MNHDELRSNNRSAFSKMLFFCLSAAAIVFLGYSVVVNVFFPAFSLRVSGEENWILLEGYASVLSLAVLLGSLAFAFAEYNDREKARYREKLVEAREETKLSHDIYQVIFDKLTAPEQEAARRWILSNITIKKDDEELAAWYQRTHAKIMRSRKGIVDGLPEGQRSWKLALNCFDYIGFIANNYWDVKQASLDWISPPIAKVWRRLGTYVAYVRTLRGANDYYVSAEYIGNLCIKWRGDRGLPDEEYIKETP